MLARLKLRTIVRGVEAAKQTIVIKHSDVSPVSQLAREAFITIANSFGAVPELRHLNTYYVTHDKILYTLEVKGTPRILSQLLCEIHARYLVWKNHGLDKASRTHYLTDLPE